MFVTGGGTTVPVAAHSTATQLAICQDSTLLVHRPEPAEPPAPRRLSSRLHSRLDVADDPRAELGGREREGDQVVLADLSRPLPAGGTAGLRTLGGGGGGGGSTGG
ncbi:hypothetical protein [Pseudonocardia sp.]|uniref:hypothetical protein n=1 Tax=Pseudonocardia sp. TaxID=60912 RepID=UPI003D0EFDE2